MPYAVKGSVAANRVAADGCCLMTAKDKFHQLPKQAKRAGGRGGEERGGKQREVKTGESKIDSHIERWIG